MKSTLATRLASERNRQNLSQRELSRNAGTACNYVHQVERGQAQAALDRIGRIAAELGISAAWLLTGEGTRR